MCSAVFMFRILFAGWQFSYLKVIPYKISINVRTNFPRLSFFSGYRKCSPKSPMFSKNAGSDRSCMNYRAVSKLKTKKTVSHKANSVPQNKYKWQWPPTFGFPISKCWSLPYITIRVGSTSGSTQSGNKFGVVQSLLKTALLALPSGMVYSLEVLKVYVKFKYWFCNDKTGGCDRCALCERQSQATHHRCFIYDEHQTWS